MTRAELVAALEAMDPVRAVEWFGNREYDLRSVAIAVVNARPDRVRISDVWHPGPASGGRYLLSSDVQTEALRLALAVALDFEQYEVPDQIQGIRPVTA